MHWSFCQQGENCFALNYRIAHFFSVGRWPYRYKDLQEKRELPGKVYVYIYSRHENNFYLSNFTSRQQ